MALAASWLAFCFCICIVSGVWGYRGHDIMMVMRDMVMRDEGGCWMLWMDDGQVLLDAELAE